MAIALGDHHANPVKTIAERERRICGELIPIGATGAVGTEVTDSGVSAARTSTGQYTITYPACSQSWVVPEYMEATSTDKFAKLVSNDPTTGTALVEIWDVSDTAIAEAVSGSYLQIVIIGTV
jgi:hypothetical protein